MVSRQSYLNKLRELNYVFKSQLPRVDMYRKQGGTHRIFVRRVDLLSDEFVASSLRQAGCRDDEIRSFLAAAKT